MNILFCTQSESLRMFDALRAHLATRGASGQSGFVVADSLAWERWLAQRPGFEGEGHLLLKEWEVTAARSGTPDLAKLARYERQLGGKPGLFGAIVADRRLFMGPNCTFTQDYRRRFSDDQLLCILQRGIEQIESLFDRLRPAMVVSFICVTMIDYLVYLFAQSRGIPVYNLRPTRVADRVSFSRILNDPAPELAAAYERLRAGASSPHDQVARAYVQRVREQHGRYEGVVAPSDKPALKTNVGRSSRLAGFRAVLSSYLRYRRSPALTDNHVPDPLRQLYYAAWKNPRSARATRDFFAGRYLTAATLPGRRYCFFPLHTEPEVSLLVYGRPFVNQIEVIRMLAMSLPVDMTLVIKEHPWMVGKRTRDAYRKMLNIPRVSFADPKLDARALLQHCTVTAVITGSVALEAAMMGRPVLTFGDCPYNLLPATMVRRCADPRHLPALLRDLIENYRYDEASLQAYVAAVYDTSASVNLYSVLLGKKNVYIERTGSYVEEIAKLGDELLRAHAAASSIGAGAAVW
jgi:hypothetical protein